MTDRSYGTMTRSRGSIFDKTSVRSRRELVAAILQEHYLPRAITGQPIGPSGFFTQ